MTICSHTPFAQNSICLKKSNKKVFATERISQAVFIELFGRSLDYSANYDRRLFKGTGGLGYTVGISYCPDPSLFSIPININYLLGAKGNYLEFGGGFTYFKGLLTNNFSDRFYESYFDNGKVNVLVGVGTIGYRFQPIKNDLIFRIGLNGWFNNKPQKQLINPYPYIALGYCF